MNKIDIVIMICIIIITICIAVLSFNNLKDKNKVYVQKWTSPEGTNYYISDMYIIKED